METPPTSSPNPSPTAYADREQALQRRVNEAARALEGQGIAPTVARIRAALGGGSPNELAPALKRWRSGSETDSSDDLQGMVRTDTVASIPPVIADITKELWQRALAAASVELRGGPTARQVAARTEEATGLRQQLTVLRDQVDHDARAYGELRAQSARHEAMARSALARAAASEARERALLVELGEANQRITALESGVRVRLQAPPRSPRATRAKRQRTKRQSKKRKRATPKAKARLKPKRLKTSLRRGSKNGRLTRRR